MQRSRRSRLWYRLLQFLCRMAAVLVFRMRCYGREHIPAAGGVLVLCNHQSNLDPVLVGICCNRRMNYLARKTLFRFAPLRWLIASLDAIPIDREGLGMAGVKETLRRLRRGEMVLIFPEGTRSHDGRLGPLMPGFSAIARRAGARIVPAAVDGAFDAWPRSRWLPRPALLRVQFGPSLAPEDLEGLSDRALLQRVRNRIADCLERARQSRIRSLRSGPEPRSPSASASP